MPLKTEHLSSEDPDVLAKYVDERLNRVATGGAKWGSAFVGVHFTSTAWGPCGPHETHHAFVTYWSHPDSAEGAE